MPILSLQRTKKKFRNDEVLFFDKMYNLKIKAVIGQPLPHQLIEDLEVRQKFFKSLKKCVLKDLVFRPHMFHESN